MGKKEKSPPKDDFKIKNRVDVLKSEYIMLEGFYEDIDRRCFTIKSWSITVAVGAIGAGLIYGKEVLLWVALVSALVFWYIEAKWRGLSYFFANRIKQIEASFRDGSFKKLTPLQVYSEWSKEFEEARDQTLNYIFKPLTPMPHMVIAIVSLIIIGLVYFDVLQL
jgi:hypothetical protein